MRHWIFPIIVKICTWSTELYVLALLSVFQSLHLCWKIANPLCTEHWKYINIFEEVSYNLKSSGLIWVSLWCDQNLCQLGNLTDWGCFKQTGFCSFFFLYFMKREISCNGLEGNIATFSNSNQLLYLLIHNCFFFLII